MIFKDKRYAPLPATLFDLPQSRIHRKTVLRLRPRFTLGGGLLCFDSLRAPVFKRYVALCRMALEPRPRRWRAAYERQIMFANEHTTVMCHSRLGTILAGLFVAIFRSPHPATSRHPLELRILHFKLIERFAAP